jgi:hypothetical protein
MNLIVMNITTLKLIVAHVTLPLKVTLFYYIEVLLKPLQTQPTAGQIVGA